MSEALGPVRYAGPAGSGYLGDQVATRNLSSDIENLIDAEIRRLLDGAQEMALELLTTHEADLREIARVLQEDEVISGETVSEIVAETGESGRG
jgi:cell division protease FtsH